MLAHQESSWLPAQAFVSILAGYETTANALSFTVYCLSANPDKEACLLREVDAFGDDVPSYQDLESFPYLDAVLRESMRLYPPATFAVREASQDCTLAGQPPMPPGSLLCDATQAPCQHDQQQHVTNSVIGEAECSTFAMHVC